MFTLEEKSSIVDTMLNTIMSHTGPINTLKIKALFKTENEYYTGMNILKRRGAIKWTKYYKTVEFQKDIRPLKLREFKDTGINYSRSTKRADVKADNSYQKDYYQIRVAHRVTRNGSGVPRPYRKRNIPFPHNSPEYQVEYYKLSKVV
jgi:hypothetical protein